jgi:P4 family phage/plasmid primase-like protien
MEINTDKLIENNEEKSVLALRRLKKLLKNTIVYDKNYNYMLFGLEKNKKYNFNKQQEIEFFDDLSLITDSGDIDYADYLKHFNHKPPDIKPLIIDLDLSRTYPSDYIFNNERIVNNKMISEVVDCYGIILGKIYGDSIKLNPKLRYAFISERPYADYKTDKKGNKSLKDGLHIVFPGIICKNKVQFVIRNEFLKIGFKDNMELNEFKESKDHVVDKGIIDKAFWCLYGHSYSKIQNNKKREWKPVYKLTKIIDSLNSKIIPIELSEGKLLKILSIRNRKINKNLKISWKPEVIKEVKKNDISINSLNNILTKDDLKLWSRVLNGLDKKRFSDYELWKNTGLKISSAFKKNEDIYDIWTKLCDESEDQHNWHNGEWYINLWNNADDRWSEQNIMNMLKNDNIKLFNKITEENIELLISNTKEFSDSEIAKINSLILKENYAVSFESNKKGNLYVFKKKFHKWVMCNNDILLHQALQDIITPIWKNVLKKYINLRAEWSKNNLDEDIKNKKSRTPMDNTISELRRICKEMQSTNKLINYTKFLKMRLSLHRPEFESILNSNPDIFVCANGVLDFSDGIFTFRDGKQEDFMSISTSIVYKKYNKEDRMVKEMHNFINSIYTDEEVKKYVMRLFSMCLSTNTWDNRIFCMLGEGSNGKSKIFDMIKIVFGYGEYYTNVASELFTQPAKRGAPTPEIMLMQYKRIISVNEIDEGVPFNGKSILQISGGSDIAGARRLNENSDNSHFRILGWVFFQTNDVPKVSGDGKNFRRRIRIIPHTTTFMYSSDEDYDKNNPLHKLIDRKLDIKLGKYAEAFLSYIVEIYILNFMGKKFDTDNLNEPEAVKKATNDYFAEINKTAIFLSKTIVVKKNTSISINSLYNKYQNWMREYNDGEKSLTKSRFIKLICSRLKSAIDKTKENLKGYDFIDE